MNIRVADGHFFYSAATLLFGGYDADELAHPAAIAKFDHARDLRKQRIVFAETDVHTRLNARAALPDNDGSAGHQLSAEGLHAEALRVGIAPIFRTASTFFMRHKCS
jgi:hypothetical protein